MKPKDIKLTAIQQKVFDACEPLIQSAVEFHKKWAMNLAEECVKWLMAKVKEFGGMASWLSGVQSMNKQMTVYNFCHYKSVDYASELHYYLSSLVDDNREDYHYKEDFPAKFFINTKKAEKYIKRYEDYYRNWITYKLKCSIEKYVTSEFVNIKDIKLMNGARGYEMFAILLDVNNKEYDYHTRAVSAGGYNIQEFHYRYITHIKEK